MKTGSRRVRPPASPRSSRLAPEIAGVRISHPERVLYPAPGLTKLELARYYEAISEWMLPHVVGRPLTLVRCPLGLAGECIFMRHSKVWGPRPLQTIRIREKTKVGEYLYIESVASLIALAQMDVLEIHTWNTRAPEVDKPDRLIIDLDPGPLVRWPEVIAAAREVRDALKALGLQSWVKTTGGVGLHVTIPLRPEHDWSTVFEFARGFAQMLEAQAPEKYSTRVPKAGREKKILLDYLRNNRTNTSVAAFSTRARPMAPVSMPLAWDELTPRLRSDRFNVKSAPLRMRKLGANPWKGYFACRQRLTAEAIAAVR